MENYILKSKQKRYDPYVESFYNKPYDSGEDCSYLFVEMTHDIKDAAIFSRKKALEIADTIKGYTLIDLDDNYVVKLGKTDYVCHFDGIRMYTECDQYLAKRISREEAFKLKNDIINFAKKGNYLIQKVSVFHLFKGKYKTKKSKSKTDGDKLNSVQYHIQSILKIISDK